jgi:hypothetical protein
MNFTCTSFWIVFTKKTFEHYGYYDKRKAIDYFKAIMMIATGRTFQKLKSMITKAYICL